MPSVRKFPWYGWVGLSLVIIFWIINWKGKGIRSHLAFFPLWFGYILVVNGLVHFRKGQALVTSSFKQWILLFIISSPVWWLFEWMNVRTEYWEYTSIEYFNRFEYIIFCSLNFSVVIPAIFATAEWIGTFDFTKRFIYFFKAVSTASSRWVFFTLGWVLLALTFIEPAYSMAFIWMALFFILDPVNYWLGFKSIISETAMRNWKTVVSLWIGASITGFFWEMWNFYSEPKWVYHIPFVDFGYIFEMPVLGYLGYLPFALELYAMYYFITGILKLKSDIPL
jgi:hypothetical protein